VEDSSRSGREFESSEMMSVVFRFLCTLETNIVFFSLVSLEQKEKRGWQGICKAMLFYFEAANSSHAPLKFWASPKIDSWSWHES
jgi:hypothetical protein